MAAEKMVSVVQQMDGQGKLGCASVLPNRREAVEPAKHAGNGLLP